MDTMSFLPWWALSLQLLELAVILWRRFTNIHCDLCIMQSKWSGNCAGRNVFNLALDTFLFGDTQ